MLYTQTQVGGVGSMDPRIPVEILVVCGHAIILTWRLGRDNGQWPLRGGGLALTCVQLRIDEGLSRVWVVMIRQRSERPSGNGSHRTLEHHSLVVALALSLRLDTIAAYRLSFIALDAALSTR